MQVRSSLTTILTMALAASAARGQTATSAPARDTLGNSTTAGRGTLGQHMLYYDKMKTEVGLDEAQQRRVQELLKSADAEFHAARADMMPPPEVSRRMAETLKDIEAAKKAGDSDRELALIKERTEIAKSYTTRRQKMMDRMKERDESLHKQITNLLRPEQQVKFEEFWPNRITGLYRPKSDPYAGMLRSPIALKAATDRLGDLTADQKTSIEGAFKSYQDAARATSQPSDPAKSPALTKLYNDVFAVFTPGQRQRVVQELSPKKDPHAHAHATTSAPAADPKPTPAAKAP